MKLYLRFETDVDVILEADEEEVVHLTSPIGSDNPGLEFQYLRDDTWYGSLPQFEYRCRHDREEYLEYLDIARRPLLIDGELYWSDELDPEDLSV